MVIGNSQNNGVLYMDVGKSMQWPNSICTCNSRD